MEVVANTQYPCYRPDYRTDRCASQTSSAAAAAAALSACDENWIYPNYTISPQAASAYGRVQLPSMYTTQRPPDQSYPSPSPSVPSPGPRLPSQLDYSSNSSGASTPPEGLSGDFSPREALLGPVRNSRNRQLSISYKHGRRHSISDSLDEVDQDDISRPGTPLDARADLMPPLSLTIPPNLDGVPMQSPYQPATPGSICSPYMSYHDYRGPTHLDGRPPSPPLSNRASGSPSAMGQYPFPGDSLPPTAGKRGVKKHTKKKLDSQAKKRICLYHLEHQNARQEDIAEQYGIERSTVSKILKHKNYWLNVDDSAETHSKNRPSKFPELEEVMRRWLQECIDNDTSISDSLVRSRALDIAKTLRISEDKFKASSGWIENFKHRHGIRSGKWTQGVKNAPVSQNPNPGLNGFQSATTLPLLVPPSSSNPYPSPPSSGSSSSEDLIQADSPDSDSSRPGERGNSGRTSLQRLDDQGAEWSSSEQVHPPLQLTTADDSQPMIDDGSQHPPYLVYPPLPANPDVPTTAQAEEAINTLMYFLDALEQPIIEDHERDTLTTIKHALFQYASGVPYTRD